MGKRGPAPKPTALRLLHGDQRCRTNLAEPQPLPVALVRPDWLSPLAAEEWDRVAPHLEAMGTARATDQAALAAYCESYARWRVLVSLAAKSPPVLDRNRDGERIVVKNPVYSQVRDASAELRVMAREFGLTPSARAGLRVELVSADQGAERYFTGTT